MLGEPTQSPSLRRLVDQLARGETPLNVGVMHLCMAAADRASALAALRAGLQARDGAGQLSEALALLETRPEVFERVKQVVCTLDHAASGPPDQTLRRLSASFDALALAAPDAGVALYCLGDEELLARATGAVVERLEAWGALSCGRQVLEIGCGAGRFLEALSLKGAGLVVGVEISAGMVAEARRRTAGLAQVSLVRTPGRDLSMFRDGSFDLVLAVDSFPYLVQAGVAGRHVQDAARLLRPGGDLVALNYAYLGAPEDHVRELLGFAEPAGLAPVRMGQRDMAGWDGVTFHLRKPGAGAATPPTGR